MKLILIILSIIVILNGKKIQQIKNNSINTEFCLRHIESNKSIFNYEDTLKTTFNNSIELIDFIKSKEYMFSYMKKVDGEEMIFNPPLLENSSYLSQNQIIYYKSKPNITFFNNLYGKISIKQKWDLSSQIINGNIETKYISFSLKMLPIKKEKNVDVKLEIRVYEKLFFVPNMLVKYAIDDFKNMFNEILNERK
tara:strand:- start:9 stop:593 length:585 start_codon:yes stop_codon:yes gene_type:complete